jgi:plastocyanin
MQVKPFSENKRGDRVPPGGTFNYTWNTLDWPTTAGVWLYHDHSIYDHENVLNGAIGIVVIHNPNNTENDVFNSDLPGESHIGSPFDQNGLAIDPPKNAQYLLLFHEVGGGTYMCMNGRWKLGNGPTVVAGVDTKMVFGIVTMGDAAHTFHIHGHRWVANGPDGIHPEDIERSIQNRAVSHFEDTRIMSAANSFGFTVKQGSFMGSVFPSDPTSGLGEWHMHCHILSHMMNGMMGSLLVVNKGDKINGQDSILQSGFFDTRSVVPVNTVIVKNFAFDPPLLEVANDAKIIFDFQLPTHTVETTNANNADRIDINNGGGPMDAVPVGQKIEVTIKGEPGGVIEYWCGIHREMMRGTIKIVEDGMHHPMEDHMGGHGGGH